MCQWLATDRWFSPVSSTNRTHYHDIAEILLNVALTINHTWTDMCSRYRVIHILMLYISDIIHMTISVTRRLNISCIMLFKITLFARLYVRVGILLIWDMHLHDRIISLRGEVWVHETSLASATFHWSACSKSGKWAIMHLCVKCIDFGIGERERERENVSAVILNT